MFDGDKVREEWKYIFDSYEITLFQEFHGFLDVILSRHNILSCKTISYQNERRYYLFPSKCKLSDILLQLLYSIMNKHIIIINKDLYGDKV